MPTWTSRPIFDSRIGRDAFFRRRCCVRDGGSPIAQDGQSPRARIGQDVFWLRCRCWCRCRCRCRSRLGAKWTPCVSFSRKMVRKDLRAVKKAKAWRAMAFVRRNRPRERKFGAILARKKLCAVDSRLFQPISGALELPCGDFPCPRGRFPPHGASSAPIQAIFSTRILGRRWTHGAPAARSPWRYSVASGRNLRASHALSMTVDPLCSALESCGVMMPPMPSAIRSELKPIANP